MGYKDGEHYEPSYGSEKMKFWRYSEILETIPAWLWQRGATHIDLYVRILSQLHECNYRLILNLVRNINTDLLLYILRLTTDREFKGGDLTSDLEHRRTPGGVFIRELKMNLDTNGIMRRNEIDEIFLRTDTVYS
jgi:hypothetical protein